MAFTDSKLVTVTKISPNSNPRPTGAKITNIVPHHMAGKLTAAQCGAIFASSSRQASSNYGIGYDCSVGLYTHESRRSWCTSSYIIDNVAVTIEISDDTNKAPWHVSDKVLKKAIELIADICKRNGIKKCTYTGNKAGVLHQHRWYANTDCPSDYLAGKFPYIASEVNKMLGVDGTVKVISAVNFREDAYIGAKIIKKLPVGTKVQYLEDDKYGWGKIKVDGKTGWCVNSYLSNKSETTWCPTQKTNVATYIRNSKGTKLIKVPKNASVKVYSVSPDNKAYVKYADIKGWMDSNKLG